MPQSVKDSRELNDNEKKFVGKVERDNYSALTLDELAIEYESVESQAQLLQGKILLEARNRFQSDNEFGAWVESVGGAICSTSRQHRTRLMNLARFFDGRELNKISISAAYEISAPANADIAIEVYELAKGKGLPLAEVRRQISIRKGESLPLPTKLTEQEQVISKSTTENEKSKQEQIMEILLGLTEGEKRHILNDCLKSLSLYPQK